MSKASAAAAAAAADKKEEASTDAHLELLTEHFGYNPKSFIDALVYLSNEHLYSIATEFENVVGGLLDSVDGGELEAEQGIHAILTLMENALDHTMDTFELYCFRSVFGIRPRQAKYMTLDHHRGLDLRPQQPTAEDKARSKGGRKSAVASANSASERSYKLGETEDSLKRQIAAVSTPLLLPSNASSRLIVDRFFVVARREQRSTSCFLRKLRRNRRCHECCRYRSDSRRSLHAPIRRPC
jgi:kinetochore protein Mis12/MTW1